MHPEALKTLINIFLVVLVALVALVVIRGAIFILLPVSEVLFGLFVVALVIMILWKVFIESTAHD